MIPLSPEQESAVNEPGDVVVTACPGSGKTRVLTCRVIKGLSELESAKQSVVALTFTNRATDEIQTRIDLFSASQEQFWAGTIHSFALDWILRPYAPYNARLKNGFSIADEFFTEKTLNELKKQAGKPNYFSVNTARNRDGITENADPVAVSILESYRSRLLADRLLDYDDILYYSFKLLNSGSEIPDTLARIIRLFCIDEIQDTQDLQYGILSSIFRNTTIPPTLFVVGDPDQSIYESLGAITKSANEIAQEFNIESVTHRRLAGNYRSTQRIIDYYQHFRPDEDRIESLASFAPEEGVISFDNQTLVVDDIVADIASLIRQSTDSGVAPNEICVLAPHWSHVREIARKLVSLLPDIDLDAPGLSPFHSQRENPWFKIARLFLSTPQPALYRTRLRWAGEVLRELRGTYGIAISEAHQKPRNLLRLINSIKPEITDGLPYLDAAFRELMKSIGFEVAANETLLSSRDLFFEKAELRITQIEGCPTDLSSFRKFFKHPSGVVISICHGIKGEEYDTVIAFGLLRGYVPNWDVIINGQAETAEDWASKLLYVVCSRAKRRLHLIAESGRLTRTRNPYETTNHLRDLRYDYDERTDRTSQGLDGVTH